jgi:hypothetical protein
MTSRGQSSWKSCPDEDFVAVRYDILYLLLTEYWGNTEYLGSILSIISRPMVAIETRPTCIIVHQYLAASVSNSSIYRSFPHRGSGGV